ncbi:MAG: dITP/XTP pyrophosphatase [Phycisphaerae bacterium]|nr:dITP/XTP pyrophosphatase [Phycisphaerae bacterium]
MNPPGRAMYTELLVATSNRGKLAEITTLLAPRGWRLLGLADLHPPLSEAVEDGDTFVANAEKKACYYAHTSGHLTLADDSGLEVEALNGQPGVHSARYAGLPGNDQANNALLIERLQAIPAAQRRARFRCAMVLAGPDGSILATTEGTIEGLVIDAPRGRNGFGYDPHFLIPHLGQTAAELPPELKNQISHRGQALTRMIERLAQIF